MLIELEVRDAAGIAGFNQPQAIMNRFDPSFGVTITVTDPVGVVKTSSAPMTPASAKFPLRVGLYRFTYQSAPTDLPGTYLYEATASQGFSLAQRGSTVGVFSMVP